MKNAGTSVQELQRVRVTNRYISRHWNVERSTRYVVDVDGSILESSHFLHLDGDEYVKDVIELPTSFGCAVGCKHCASALIDAPKLLSNQQIIDLCRWTANQANLHDDSEFLITFSGIGEGALVGTRIFEAARSIYGQFRRATFTFTTSGVDPEFVLLADLAAEHLPTRYLQISFLHHVDALVNEIIPTAKNFKYSVQDLVAAIKTTSNIRVRLNIVVIDNFNSAREVWAQWLALLEPVRQKIAIRVSALNETAATRKYGLLPAPHSTCRALVETFLREGYDAYFFASTQNDNLNCGQLIWQYKDKLKRG